MGYFEMIVFPGILFIAIASAVYYGILRKLSARMQNRIGPPVWQPLTDLVKLASKEDIRPESAKPGFSFWPALALASAIMAGLMIPVIKGYPAPVSGDIIIILYFLVLSSISAYMAGLASGNPFGAVGSVRGIVQMVGYEFPFIVSLLVPFIAMTAAMPGVGLSPSLLTGFQSSAGWMSFTYPIAAVVFLLAIMGKAELPPFHIPNAKQELVSGYTTEYTGFRLALLELAHMVKLFVMLSLAVAVFFGGSSNILIFFLKTLGLLVIFIVIKNVMARNTIGSVFRFYWMLGAIALIDLVRALMFA